jgi:hypothetical protein
MSKLDDFLEAYRLLGKYGDCDTFYRWCHRVLNLFIPVKRLQNPHFDHG